MKAYINKNSKTKHSIGKLVNDEIIEEKIILNETWIEISKEADGVYLYRYNKDNICISDTWHQTIEEAKAQANYEYGINEDDWIE